MNACEGPAFASSAGLRGRSEKRRRRPWLGLAGSCGPPNTRSHDEKPSSPPLLIRRTGRGGVGAADDPSGGGGAQKEQGEDAKGEGGAADEIAAGGREPDVDGALLEVGQGGCQRGGELFLGRGVLEAG